MKCDALRNAGVERHGVGQVRARHKVRYECHARRIEHDVERGRDGCAGENMPDLNQAGERQNAKCDRDEKISEGRDQENFLSIEEIRQRAAE